MPPRPTPEEQAEIDALVRELADHKFDFFLVPSLWGTVTAEYTWATVRFTRENAELVPEDSKGIYSFVMKPGIAGHFAAYLLYIGETVQQSLRDRYRQYFTDRRGKIRRWMLRFPDHLYFSYTVIDDVSQISSIEKLLINAFIPIGNSRFSGKVGEARKAF